MLRPSDSKPIELRGLNPFGPQYSDIFAGRLHQKTDYQATITCTASVDSHNRDSISDVAG
jgi:hypothetical protein